MSLHSFTLVDMLARNAQLYSDKTAFVFGARRVTHAEHYAAVERMAAGLARIGVGDGDRIVILSDNNLEFIALYGAAAWLGAIVTPINWRLSADEIAFIVDDSEPDVVMADVAHQEFFRTTRKEFRDIRHWIGIGGGAKPFVPLEAILATGGKAPPPSGAATDTVVMIHTAAVGGRPRGAMLSQAGLIASNLQAMICWSLTPGDVNYGVLPLFHVAGLNILLACQHAGGASIIVPKFDATEAVRAITSEKATLLAEFPPILGSLLDAAGDSDSLASLRAVTGLDTPGTIARFEQKCPGASFYVAFGQSETSGFVTMAPFREKPGSAGRPMFLSTVAIVGEDDRPVNPGETGEIVVRGPVVFEGYWNCEEDSAATSRNGWHHTGDMGAFDDDGYLWYKGRSPAKELIKPGGENVYPAEVEAALKAHPAVAEAVVFGVPDQQWGEAVKAVCTLRAGASATPQEIIDFVAGRIARYKRPKYLVIAASLPKTAAGATDRARVKTDFAGA